MKGTLVITILTVRSSYLREVEEPLDADGVPDTIQWWIAPSGSWRIRTFGMDHDIHTHSLGDGADLLELAKENARKHYGDVIQSHHVIELADCTDTQETARALLTSGLEPRIEIAAGRFVFWKPDDTRYHTQSQPK